MSVPNVPVVPGDMGNTRTISPAKSWCFTCNNYTEEDFLHIKKILVPICSYVGIGKEVGEQGTPHLQGYFKLLVKNRPKTIFKDFTKCHFKKCKGSHQQNIIYCSKDSDYWFYDINQKEQFIQEIKEFYDWEKTLIKIIDEKPDDRTIYWVWGKNGCNGKTTFQKWIGTHYKSCMILEGKGADMKNGIVQFYNDTKRFPRIILVNIPKSVEHVSWGGLEQIKDMCFYSGKYEGGTIIGPCPHLIVFSNQEPPYDKYSENRHIELIEV